MATTSFTTPSSPLTMAALAAFLDSAFGELLNRHRGASAPDSPVEGQLWWDSSGDPVDVLKRYTVAAGWVSILTVNKTTGAVTIQSLTLTAAATGFTIAGGTTSKTLTLDTDVTASNLMLKTGSNLAIGSDANGDMYYRASDVLARLAKGDANTKLFMNAGATAPEWANGMKVITSTRDMTAASGDVSYSGVGFKPSGFFFMGGIDASMAVGFGFVAGTDDASVGYNISAPNYNINNAATILVYTTGGYYQLATLKSWDADGFTLTWTKSGYPSGTCNLSFYCFR